MDDPSLSAVHQTIESFSRAHYTWVQPILRALTRLGGGATPKEVKASIRQHEAAQLSDDQWAYVLKNGRIGWARLGLRQSGLIGGPHGRWELTELARRYADATASDAFEIDEELPTLAMAPSQATKSVQVTHRSGYEIPLLAVLADGINRKKDIRQAIRERLADKLLAGDFERLPQGAAVWTFRLAWCLSHLKRNGEAKNTGHGIWEITAAGRERLEVEGPAWRIEPHQQSRAKVVVTDAPASKVEAAAEPWAVATWRALRRRIAPDIFDALDQRLRPDLGPTPADTSNFVPRNVVLYGPPGTGKTHVARQIAAALCGDAPESDDDEPRWRIVQFHPSYAYED
ncbi:MAG: AAA family ATPase, partial [Myxococcales bacterium]|nr:AAA family ATPase [Myxococcales bacterium]